LFILIILFFFFFFFSSRRRHTRSKRDWSSDVCSSDLIRHGRSRNQIVPARFRLLPCRIGRGQSQQNLVDRGLERALVDAATHGGVALWIEIHQEHAHPGLREARREIDAGRGLSDPALLVGDGEDAGHACSIKTRCRSASSPGTAKACTCRTRKSGGKRSISSKGWTPFIAPNTPPGASKCFVSAMNSAISANAREMMQSNFSPACHASTRSHITVAFFSRRSATACRRK